MRLRPGTIQLVAFSEPGMCSSLLACFSRHQTRGDDSEADGGSISMAARQAGPGGVFLCKAAAAGMPLFVELVLHYSLTYCCHGRPQAAPSRLTGPHYELFFLLTYSCATHGQATTVRAVKTEPVSIWDSF